MLYLLAGPGYLAAGTALVLTIAAMSRPRRRPSAGRRNLARIRLRAGDEANWILFMLAVVIVVDRASKARSTVMIDG